MSRAISPVTGKPYGLAAVCRVWRLARSGVYRQQSTAPQRRGPVGAMADDALTTAIQDVLAASRPSRPIIDVIELCPMAPSSNQYTSPSALARPATKA